MRNRILTGLISSFLFLFSFSFAHANPLMNEIFGDSISDSCGGNRVNAWSCSGTLSESGVGYIMSASGGVTASNISGGVSGTACFSRCVNFSVSGNGSVSFDLGQGATGNTTPATITYNVSDPQQGGNTSFSLNATVKCTNADYCTGGSGGTCNHDGVVGPGEQCDGNNFGGKTCQDLGFAGGTLNCTSSCEFNTSNCRNLNETCGNGLAEGSEYCDGDDFRGASCESLGFPGGTLNCKNDCTYNVSGCSGGGGNWNPPPPPGSGGGCGDGSVTGNEDCDLGSANGACPSACSSTCHKNTCGSCELPVSPYFSENFSDLTTYARRLENGTCYRTMAPVDSRCIWATPTSTYLGRWAAPGNDQWSATQWLCSTDNLHYGQVVYRGGYDNQGEKVYFSEQTCARRYDCSIDNAPTVDIDCNGADSCTISYNSTATIDWSSTKATSCTASGDWSGGKDLNGSITAGPLTATKTYTLSCTGSSGLTSEDSVVVTVEPPLPVSVGVSLGDNPIDYGETTNIIWRSVNASACTASDAWSGSKALSGTENTGLLLPGRYTYTLSCTGQGTPGQGSAILLVNMPIPDAYSVTYSPPDYCSSGPGGYVVWSYFDPVGSPQAKYQVQITNTGSFNDPIYDSGQITSSSKVFAIPNGVLQFNITYKARVRVWDTLGGVSSWSSPTSSWKTPSYAYPQVDFNWMANNILNNPSPPLNKPVQFTDTTVFGGNQKGREWDWTFGDGGASTTQNPSHTYVVEGSDYVTLTATDSANQTCTRTKGPLIIQKPIPKWREVAPK